MTATPDTFTPLQMEAALCLWEAMLDARLESTLPAMDAAFEAGGSHTMRQHAIALVPFVLNVRDALPESLREGAYGFDYQIVPAILTRVIWVGSGYVLPPLESAVADVAAALAEGV